MHHTCAFFAALANVADTDIPAIADNVLAINNGHFFPQRDYDLLYASVSAVTLLRAKLVSPTNRQVTLPFIRPIAAALLPANDPNVADYRDNPFRIRALEELAIQATDSAAGPNNCTAVVGLSSGMVHPGKGDVFTLRGTSTTAAVANAWTQIAMTWADSLPAGQYEVIGAECIATNQLAFRLSFENQFERPGGLGNVAEANRGHKMFEKGGLGVWGRFTSTRMPNVEVLNNGTDAVHSVFLDIIRLR